MEVRLMQEYLMFDLPQSLSFKIAFAAVTVLYAVSMAVLLVLYRKAKIKVPPKRKAIKSKRHKHRQP